MKTIYTLFSLAIAFVWITFSCNNSSQAPKAAVDSTSMSKDGKACKPIKDPNNPKPMALMMRMMAANADSMRSEILRGEKLDSLKYPFIKFYLAEPTDSNVLEMQFFDNARLFQVAYKQVFQHPTEQKKYYNLLINSCIHCHESYCSGPLKRIRKFPIE